MEKREGQCRFRDCQREARKGWTMCDRHYSAGGSLKNQKRKDVAQQKVPVSFAFSNTRIKPHGTERVHWAVITYDIVQTACGMRLARVKNHEVRADVTCERCLKAEASSKE